MILLLAAVPAETERLRHQMHPVEEIRRTVFTLFAGRIGTQQVGLLHGGVGKVNTAIALTALLERVDCRMVLQLGCGGAYPDSGLEVGDLALASEEIYGDEGSHSPTGFLDMQDLSLPTALIGNRLFYNRYPLREPLIQRVEQRLTPWLQSQGIRLQSGPFVTVSCCSGLTEGAQALRDRTGGICESMEGAAAAQICAQRGLPFLEIRGISNLTVDRDFSRWNLPLAVGRAQDAVLQLLDHWHELEL